MCKEHSLRWSLLNFYGQKPLKLHYTLLTVRLCWGSHTNLPVPGPIYWSGIEGGPTREYKNNMGWNRAWGSHFVLLSIEVSQSNVVSSIWHSKSSHIENCCKSKKKCNNCWVNKLAIKWVYVFQFQQSIYHFSQPQIEANSKKMLILRFDET